MKRIDVPGTGIPPHHRSDVVMIGDALSTSKAAMIMVHGRGATAESILELSNYFLFDNVAYLAPQAESGLWYPYSFLVPIEQNEPNLTSALHRLTDVVDYVVAAGIPEHKIMLLGFSQGASLSMEWTARSGRNIGALFGLSGGLIGPPGTPRNYPGTLTGTSVFIGCSDVDFHIPKERVTESAEVFKRLNANVTMKLYPNMPHTVNDDEIAVINAVVKRTAGL